MVFANSKIKPKKMKTDVSQPAFNKFKHLALKIRLNATWH